jgi:dTDP-4-amino-4,6-dideoxygalactose transaminase
VVTVGGTGFDQALLARSRAALDAWEPRMEGPSSSLTGGGAISLLERRFADYCGVRYALALPSGTLALRAALAAVGVRPGSRVVVPALDWPAAAAAVLSLNARPVPADTTSGWFLVDPQAVEARLDRHTRAVVVTHIAGVPADLTSLRAVCDDRGIALIEDGSQALGARTEARPVGSFGAAGVFSLGPGKLVDAGEGGVLVTDRDDLYRAAVRATQHPLRQLRGGIHPPDPLALSARIHPLAAIVGVHGLDGIEHELVRRRQVAGGVVAVASGITGVTVPAEAAGQRFAWPCVPAMVTTAGAAILANAGLGAAPLGIYDITRQLRGDSSATPNAGEAARRACRLYPIRAGRLAQLGGGIRPV